MTRRLLNVMMIRFVLVIVALLHFTILNVSALSIGSLPQYLYYPTATALGPNVAFYYSSDCRECLCHVRALPTNSVVAINCLRDTRVCFLYRNFNQNYVFRRNSSGQIYFFQLPPHPPLTLETTTITSQITTYAQTTMRSTSK